MNHKTRTTYILPNNARTTFETIPNDFRFDSLLSNYRVPSTAYRAARKRFLHISITCRKSVGFGFLVRRASGGRFAYDYQKRSSRTRKRLFVPGYANFRPDRTGYNITRPLVRSAGRRANPKSLPLWLSVSSSWNAAQYHFARSAYAANTIAV